MGRCKLPINSVVESLIVLSALSCIVDSCLADGDATFSSCRAGLDGGGLYTSASVIFSGTAATTTLLSNSAGGSGGAIMAYGCAAQLRVNLLHSLAARKNTAGLDGGALALDQGASLHLDAETCAAIGCDVSNVGNGVCDPVCLSRGCNWWVLVFLVKV